MPEVRRELQEALHAALTQLGIDPVPGADQIAVTQPRERTHGDWSSNAAFVCARSARRPPRKLAGQLAELIAAQPPAHLASVEVAGAGFVNFKLTDTWLHETLREAIGAGVKGYGCSSIGAGITASVEFVSANPTGPLHAGHGRWAAYGDSLCRLLERCGYRVVREFYVNDRGHQTELFAASLEARKRGAQPPADGYHGDYVIDWAEQMPDGADTRGWGLQRARQDQARTLAALNVAFDIFTSEAALVARGAMDDVLAELRRRGVVYGKDGAVWLRSGDTGDTGDTGDFEDADDRVLVKSNGEPTYFLPDIAYHHEKFSRGDLVIDVLGADHHGYVPRMRAALAALGHEPGSYEALIGQNVTLRRQGTEVRLAKRSGDMVLVSELLDEVGPDVTRLVYLLQSIDTTQTIDIDVVSAQSAENPVYYLQYAHARIHSLGRQAATRGVCRAPLDDVSLARLVHERELDVLRVLAVLPDVITAAMQARAPHKVTTWARELAAAFHRFWHDCPILRDDVPEDLRQARLWLVEATRVGLAVALEVLGVSAPERL